MLTRNITKFIYNGSRHLSGQKLQPIKSILGIKPILDKNKAKTRIEQDFRQHNIYTDKNYVVKLAYVPMLVNNDVNVKSTCRAIYHKHNDEKREKMKLNYSLKYPIYESSFKNIIKPKLIAELMFNNYNKPIKININDDDEVIPSKSINKSINDKVNNFIFKEAKIKERDIRIDNGVKYTVNYEADINMDPRKHNIVHYPYYYTEFDYDYGYRIVDGLTGVVYHTDISDEDGGILGTFELLFMPHYMI